MTDQTASFAHQLVFRVAERCFGGCLPDNPDIVLGAIIMLFPGATEAQLAIIEPDLRAAVAKYQAMQHCQRPL